MADAAAGLERSIDTTGYSPIAGGDRGTADRVPRSPAASINAPHPDLAGVVRLLLAARLFGGPGLHVDRRAGRCFATSRGKNGGVSSA